jgi:3-oxoacyl-[acyl-carrier protein] reductase
MDVRGKTAIVTGSAVGVGRATALDLAKRGANVVVNYSRSEDDAKEAVRLVEAAGAKALLVKADVSKEAEVRDMVAKTVAAFGGLHILVNNAATTHFVGFPDLDGMKEEYWDDIFAVNVKGAFLCSRAAAPAIRESGGGAIVNVASVAGVRAVGSSIAYAASKAALINMTVALARVLGPEIRVNAVAPGFIETPMTDPLPQELKDKMKSLIPLGRFGKDREIAAAIVFLASDEASYITGQVLDVNGGMHMG